MTDKKDELAKLESRLDALDRAIERLEKNQAELQKRIDKLIKKLK